jgi:predicted RNase H-like nuclease (RuvC/YqgF family)
MQEDQLVLKETAENGFLNEMLRQAQELETRARAYAESYPEPPGKLSARVEQLENEIVELKKALTARDTVIRQLEQRLAMLEAERS